MENRYFKENFQGRIEISPIVYRLQACAEYKSPWKMLPSIKKEGKRMVYEEKPFIDIRKKRLKLELPKITGEEGRNLTSFVRLEQKSYRKIRSKIFSSFHDGGEVGYKSSVRQRPLCNYHANLS